MAALLVTLVRVFVVRTVLCLVGLGYVWLENFRDLQSKHAFGLVLFGAFLLGENLVAAYFFIGDLTLSAWITNAAQVPPIAQQAMTTLRVLEFAGFVFLTWITWD